MSIRRIVLTILSAMIVTGCGTYNFPSPLWETQVARILSDVERTHPQEKLYRQYVSGRLYMQFERISDNDVIYGWVTCTDCSWTRKKMAAIYSGSYLYVIYGHHEAFFLREPKKKVMYPNEHWSWNVVDKYQVEGRNLVLLTQYRECLKASPTVKEWSNKPYVPEVGQMDCRYAASGSYNSVYVATIDDTLVGKKDSIVGSERETVKERLNALEELYRDGTITESEYRQKRREILDDL